MSSSLPRLTSLSTQTLTLIFERQRLQSLSGSTESSISIPSSSLAHITRNLSQLRIGIHDLEDQQRSGGASPTVEASKLLREQYARMRDMMGGDKENVEPLRPLLPPESPPKDEYGSRQGLDPISTPYKDDPDVYPYGDDPDTQPFDSAEVLESQRLMMQDQDTHLDSLHSSLTRQHSLSQQLSSELDVQAGLLTELDTDLDYTTTRLDRARQGLDKIGRGLGANASTVTIAVLILVLLILIIVFKT
ncbi:hypothetical protein K439DRAFT_1660789 [Ramaria rubella]|nr:hypothetical protein K439DRAFT_1660789 [Ramaria rubella]